jgi:hypothetical protein
LLYRVLMKGMLAATALTILVLVGATRLPPADLSRTLDEFCAPLNPNRRASNELNAATTLKTLASAQADFRANDRDQDGVNQFWRGDVAGLYALSPKGGPPIRLIQREVAASDDRPVTRLPGIRWKAHAGYRIRAIRHADENPNALDPQRFAFVAYPESPSAGRYMYVIDENNSVRSSAECPPGGIFDFPTDQELRSWGRPG